MTKQLTKPDAYKFKNCSELKEEILDHLIESQLIAFPVEGEAVRVDLENHKNVSIRAIWRSGKNLLLELSDQYVISINHLDSDQLQELYNYVIASTET